MAVDLITSPEVVAEIIIEQQFKGYTDTLSEEDRVRFLTDMKSAAKDSILLKLYTINTTWKSLNDILTALGNIPSTILQGITTAATLMPPPAGTTVLVSQLQGDIPLWQAQAAEANAKVSSIRESLNPIANLPVVAPFIPSLDTISETVFTIQTALGSIPL